MTDLQLLAGERQPRESSKAMIACNDYLRLGPARSLAKLLDRYRTGAGTPPTKRLNTLKNWSARYGWQARASAYDAAVEREKTERARAVMQSGLGQAHERVRALKALAGGLLDEVRRFEGLDPEIVWLNPGESEEGDGLFARFNEPFFRQLRGLLDDLAKETGGRRQKRDNFNLDMARLSDDQLQRIAAGEDPLDVLLSAASGSGA